MTEFILLLLLQITVFSSVTALILIAVKQIFKCRIPPLIGMIMWTVLLARLLCPIFPESRLSVYNILPASREILYTLKTDVAEEAAIRAEERAAASNPYVLRTVERPAVTQELTDVPENVDESGDVPDDSVKEEPLSRREIVTAVLLSAYLLGAVTAVTLTVGTYCTARRRALRYSAACTDEALDRAYRAAAASLGIRENRVPELRVGQTAMLVGVIHPVVICPEGTDPSDASMMFAHELNHYKYGDNPLLLFSALVGCLYWFNPLIWIVRHMLREDMEVLCDSRTLSSCGIRSTEYAMMLCRLSAFDELRAADGCHMSASGRRLKNRLLVISRRRKDRFLPRLGSGLLCAVIIAVCLTNPVLSMNDEYEGYISHYAELTGESERLMRLSSGATVSMYLDELSHLLTDAGANAALIGGGRLEKFKRLSAESDRIDADLKEKIAALKTGDVLTNRSLAIVDAAAVALLGGTVSEETALLPLAITADDMAGVLAGLTEAERETLLSCYNRGVRGAHVTYEAIYTEAMMKLILSRIHDKWERTKFSGFYSEVTVNRENAAQFSDYLADSTRNLKPGTKVYVRAPSVTPYEEETLKEILVSAFAGQREDLYYLKKNGGCPAETAEELFRKSGYTVDEMLDGYAYVGMTGYRHYEAKKELSADDYEEMYEKVSPVRRMVLHSLYEETENGYRLTNHFMPVIRDTLDELNAIAFPLVTTETATVLGTADGSMKELAQRMTSIGLLRPDDEGAVDLSVKFTCGESLYYAYRFVASMTNSVG